MCVILYKLVSRPDSAINYSFVISEKNAIFSVTIMTSFLIVT